MPNIISEFYFPLRIYDHGLSRTRLNFYSIRSLYCYKIQISKINVYQNINTWETISIILYDQDYEQDEAEKQFEFFIKSDKFIHLENCYKSGNIIILRLT